MSISPTLKVPHAMNDNEKQNPASNGVGPTDRSTVCGLEILRSEDDFWRWVQNEWRNAPALPKVYPCFARRDFDSDGLEWPFYIDMEYITQMRAALLSNIPQSATPGGQSPAQPYNPSPGVAL